MSLHAQQFFTEHLALPFAGGTVVGDAYYATPLSASPLRLQITFARTIRTGEYDGLRLQVLHADQGVLDTATLKFADHHTFRRRDTARGLEPGWDGYACIRDWSDRGEPPWQGAEVTALRQAIEQYATVWFPQAPEVSGGTAAAERMASTGPAPLPGPNGFWLTDPAFRARMHTATLTMLDLVEGVMDFDMTLTEALQGVREEVPFMLGIPDEYGVLVEAEAAAQIVKTAGLTAGSPFGPTLGKALARIEQRPVEEQQHLVQTAAHRYAITAPPRTRPAPAVAPPRPAPGRSR
ncbi:hypothetical protein T261_0799 [Streptomyces lydicus]|nr:hypothetical protein T261_0799 [Streptomyces lydicus]